MGAELTLQLSAYRAWNTRNQSSRGNGKHRVLCVGDSLTWGLGATEPATDSYPPQLQNILQSQIAPDWEVVQGGWPGRNSGSTLEALPNQLLDHRPAWVCILIGANDRNDRPARLETPKLERTAEHFPVKFRLGTYFFLNPRRHEESTPSEVAQPQSKASPVTEALQAVLDAVTEERWVDAVRLGQSLIDTGEEQPVLRASLVKALVQLDLSEDAHAHVKALQEQHEEPYREDVESALASALIATEQFELAFDLARDSLSRRGTSLSFLEMLYQVATHTKRVPLLLSTLEEVSQRLEHAPKTRGDVLDFRALLLLNQDPVASLTDHIRAALISGRVGLLIEQIYASEAIYTKEIWDRALASLDLEDDQRRLMQDAYEQRAVNVTNALEIFKHHLQSMVALCRKSGAHPVLLTYPQPLPWHRRITTEVAAVDQVMYVDTRQGFDELLKTRSLDELFAFGDHCTDAGYQAFAEIVAQKLRPHLR